MHPWGGHCRHPLGVVVAYGWPLACWQPSELGPPSGPASRQNWLQPGAATAAADDVLVEADVEPSDADFWPAVLVELPQPSAPAAARLAATRASTKTPAVRVPLISLCRAK
jgi:hypothetical protein